MAHLLIGMFVGAIIAAALVVSGQPLWLAVLAYSCAGALAVVGSAAVAAIRQRPASADSRSAMQAEGA